MLEWKVRDAVNGALISVFPELEARGAAAEIEMPREKAHGDFATNVAMGLARELKTAPRNIAEKLVAALEDNDLFESVEIAGPGFINFRVAPGMVHDGLSGILSAGENWGESDFGEGEAVQVEFVSANPTGPLNVVNARAAAYGSTLTRLLTAAGYGAKSEFYVNDVGRQIDLLGESFLARYREIHGDDDFEIPDEGYQGEYLLELAAELDPKDLKPSEGESEIRLMSRLAVDRMLIWQKEDLLAYGTEFDRWFRQSELYPHAVERALGILEDQGHVYEKDDARWFEATKFGDEQDRVLVRANGEPTYFLADLAYHMAKHERGFQHAIDIWGPDHHGYIARMTAGMEALGYGRDWLEVLIVQQVNLVSGGKPVKMSKRKGEFITLRDLMDDVGKDTAAFFFLMRRAESHLDFDIDLARKESDENPVYYVKYAHARISGILRKAEEDGVEISGRPAFSRLEDPHELTLAKALLQFPAMVAGAARNREPHRVTNYLRAVSQDFHLFYHNCRVIGDDPELTEARLGLTLATRIVLANGLGLMDIEAPERM